MGAPLPPPLPTPQMASPNIQPRMGDRGVYIPNPPGTLPYQNIPDQVVNGINQFVSSLLQSKEAVKEHFKNKFYDSVQQMAQGIPLDQNEVLKYAQKGGIPIRTEPETPEETAFKQAGAAATNAQMMQMQNPQGSPEGSMMYGTGAIPNAAQMQPPTTPPPAPQEPQRSLMQKFLGRYPAVQEGSPAQGWLQDVVQATKEGGGLPGQISRAGRFANIDMRLKELGLESSSIDENTKAGMAHILKGVMANDQVSMRIASHFGLAKIPGEEMTELFQKADPSLSIDQAKSMAAERQLFLMMGGPQMNMKLLQMGSEMAPRFGGDAGQAIRYVHDLFSNGSSTLSPSRTPSEMWDLTRSLNTWATAYPDAPLGPIKAMVDAELSGTKGGKDYATQVGNYISQHWQRANTIEQKQFSQRLGFDWSNLNQHMDLARNEFELSKLKAIEDSLDTQSKEALQVMSNDKLPIDQRNAAAAQVANAVSKLSGLKVKYNGQEIAIRDPARVLQEWAGGSAMSAMNPFSPNFGKYSTPYLAPPGSNPNAFGPGQQMPGTVMGRVPPQSPADVMRSKIQGMTPEEFRAAYGRLGSSSMIDNVANWLQQRDQTQQPAQPQQDDQEE